MRRILKEEAVLVAIDFQERLMPVMKDNKELEKNVIQLAKGCRILGMPVLVTQQYTKGLGPTVPAVTEALGEYEVIEKTAFSVMGEPAFSRALANTGRKSVILAGIEAHICVQQTALDLLDAGYSVYLINDCISSRSAGDRKSAIRRIAASGAVATTGEAILFELLGGAKEPGFKEISALVK